MKVLFVCMGNICRSPSAQGVYEKHIENMGLSEKYMVDSAGTHSYHVGSKPDSRSANFALKRGIDLTQQKSRLITESDFERFDYIVAMDDENYKNIKLICPIHHHTKIHKMMSFFLASNYTEIPDPYYGGDQGFELVLDLLEMACVGLHEHIHSA